MYVQLLDSLRASKNNETANTYVLNLLKFVIGKWRTSRSLKILAESFCCLINPAQRWRYIEKNVKYSPGHKHIWISVSCVAIGWGQNQNKVNIFFFFFILATYNAAIGQNKISICNRTTRCSIRK